MAATLDSTSKSAGQKYADGEELMSAQKRAPGRRAAQCSTFLRAVKSPRLRRWLVPYASGSESISAACGCLAIGMRSHYHGRSLFFAGVFSTSQIPRNDLGPQLSLVQ